MRPTIFTRTKLPKRTFRARLPPNFHRTICVSQNERFVAIASTKFPTNKGFIQQTQRFARCFRYNFHRRSQFAFRHSFVPSTHRILREGSSSKSKMRVSLQRRAIPHFKIHVLLQRRTQKCMNQAQEARGQHAAYKNHHFTTVSDI